MNLAEKLNREWLEDRLAQVPAWYLALYVLTNVGLATTWLVLHLLAGHTVWALFFSVLDALAIAIVVWAILVKRRRRREARGFLNQLPTMTPNETNTR
jgi:Flp pilus assembly protein TadB